MSKMIPKQWTSSKAGPSSTPPCSWVGFNYILPFLNLILSNLLTAGDYLIPRLAYIFCNHHKEMERASVLVDLLSKIVDFFRPQNNLFFKDISKIKRFF